MVTRFEAAAVTTGAASTAAGTAACATGATTMGAGAAAETTGATPYLLTDNFNSEVSILTSSRFDCAIKSSSFCISLLTIQLYITIELLKIK